VWYGYTIRNWLIGDERSVLIIKLAVDGEEGKASVMLIRLSIQIFATDQAGTKTTSRPLVRTFKETKNARHTERWWATPR
jgi:hypothetical protein